MQVETDFVDRSIRSSVYTDANDTTSISQPYRSSEHQYVDGTTLKGKLQRSRERNREHARKTRHRKKAHLESLKLKLAELQSKNTKLSMRIEESNVANILLSLGSNQQTPDGEEPSSSSGASITGPSEIWKGNLVEYIKKTVWSEAKRGRYLGQVGSGMAGMSSKNSSDNGESKNSDSIDEGENDSISDFGSENEDDVEFEPEMENNLKISKFGGLSLVTQTK